MREAAPLTIDTLEYVDNLIAAGVDPSKPRRTLERVRGTLAPQLVTKADLDAAVARIEPRMAELEPRMLRYMVVQTAVFAGIVLPCFRS